MVGEVVRQVIDLPPVRPTVTDHVAYRCRCECGTVTVADLPPEAKAPVIANELVFDKILAVLTEGPASPALRSALYDVAAELPGATLDGHVTDSLGRSGTAVEYPSIADSDEIRLLIDPTTGQLLEEQGIANRNSGVPVGTIIYQTTYVREGPTHQVGALPTTTAAG